MAIVKYNGTILELTGSVGGLVFKKSPQGKTIVTKCPDMSSVKWSPAQRAHRERFRNAVAYARRALATPEVRLEYERRAKELDKRPWDLAVSDYFKGRDLLAETAQNQ